MFNRDQAGFEWPKNTFMHGCEAAKSSSSNKKLKAARKQKRDLGNTKTKRSWMPWS
jgi:hypothetical protein